MKLSFSKTADSFRGPNVSTATGWKSYWAPKAEYFANLWVAASLAAEPASWAASSTYESASVQITVTSHIIIIIIIIKNKKIKVTLCKNAVGAL